jgi:hypothetical protein
MPHCTACSLDFEDGDRCPRCFRRSTLAASAPAVKGKARLPPKLFLYGFTTMVLGGVLLRVWRPSGPAVEQLWEERTYVAIIVTGVAMTLAGLLMWVLRKR